MKSTINETVHTYPIVIIIRNIAKIAEILESCSVIKLLSILLSSDNVIAVWNIVITTIVKTLNTKIKYDFG